MSDAEKVALRRLIGELRELRKTKDEEKAEQRDQARTLLHRDIKYDSNLDGPFFYKKPNNRAEYRADEPREDFIRRVVNTLIVQRDTINELLGTASERDIELLIKIDERLPAVLPQQRQAVHHTAFEAIPAEYLRRIQLFTEGSASDMATLFGGGYKIVLRVAFENTGRIAREVIKFETVDGITRFKWFFQADQADGRSHRRINEGTVIAANPCYMLVGFHDSNRALELRQRVAIIQRHPPVTGVTARAQMGVVASTNAEHDFPAATKFIWFTAPITLTEKEEETFLDRIVGFFGEPYGGGLENLAVSFDNEMDKGIITTIWHYIDNRTRGERILSARQDDNWVAGLVDEQGQPTPPAQRILSERWRYILDRFRDAPEEEREEEPSG